MRKITALLASSAALVILATGPARADGPDVVVSIKPIHSLVAAIMEGVGEPALIVEGGASPHTYSMKPSNAAALQEADIVFWIGHGLEAFLEKPIGTLGGAARVVALDETPGLKTLPFREGGAFEGHDDGEGHEHGAHDHGTDEASHDHGDHDHAHGEAGHAEVEEGKTETHAAHDHAHGGTDMHLWLDPDNAKAMARQIASTLEEIDPANAARYSTNTASLVQRIDAMDAEIVETVAAVKDKPFVVFHDAYQYFEQHYGVRVAGSITVSPETLPGAERLTEIRARITELGATCVFAEPQFEPKLVNVVIEGTSAKSGTLDPEGGSLTSGPDLYVDLMKGIATSLRDCLSSPS